MPEAQPEAEDRLVPSAPAATAPGAWRAPHNLALFAWMWAFFTLCHQGKPGNWARSPLEVGQTVAALAVLVRPSPGRLVALAFLQAANLLWWMPDPTNHAVFALLADLTLLAAAFMTARARRLDAAALYRRFAPAVRIGLLVLYFYATFHKLNSAFLDPDLSCATDHYTRLRAVLARALGADLLPAGRGWAWAAIGGTLLAEGGIPLLLFFRRTRMAGILVATVFHYVLAANVFHDFSAMVLALFVLFAPDDAAARLASAWRASPLRAALLGAGSRLRPGAGRRTLRGAAFALALAVLLVAAGNSWQGLGDAVFVAWLLYGTVVLGGLAVLHRSARSAPLVPLARPFAGAGVLLAMPALVALNGLQPYLGIKTDSSFAMYSNLRTEAGYWNHVVAPEAMRVFGFQDDLVRVIESTDPFLRSLAQRELAVPFYVLRDHVSARAGTGRRPIRLAFERNGTRVELRNAELDPELSRPYPYLARKVMKFRFIPLARPGMCGH